MNASATRVLTALVLAEVVSAFESTLVLAALSVFLKMFDDPLMVGWIVTVFLLGAAVSASICGRLGDMFGRKRVLLIVLAASFVGSMVSALATGAEGIIAGRAIQGLAGAILPLCFGIVRERLPLARVPFGIGVVSATAYVSGGVGFFLGGLIVDHFSWQLIFYLSAAASAVAFIAVCYCVPERASAPVPQRIDWLGAVLLAPAVAGVLIAISKAKLWGWDDPRTLGLVLGSLALLAVWAWHERRLASPLIDVRLFGNRQIALANLCSMFVALGPLQSGILLSLLLQQQASTGVGLGLSATLAGMIQAPALMLALVGGPWSGAIAARHGARRAVLFGCMMLLVGWAAVMMHHGSVWFVAIMVLLQGMGMAMVYAGVPMLIVEVAPADRTSEATGLSSVVRYIFTAIGAQWLAFMLATATVSDPSQGAGSYPGAVGVRACARIHDRDEPARRAGDAGTAASNGRHERALTGPLPRRAPVTEPQSRKHNGMASRAEDSLFERPRGHTSTTTTQVQGLVAKARIAQAAFEAFTQHADRCHRQRHRQVRL